MAPPPTKPLLPSSSSPPLPKPQSVDDVEQHKQRWSRLPTLQSLAFIAAFFIVLTLLQEVVKQAMTTAHLAPRRTAPGRQNVSSPFDGGNASSPIESENDDDAPRPAVTAAPNANATASTKTDATSADTTATTAAVTAPTNDTGTDVRLTDAEVRAITRKNHQLIYARPIDTVFMTMAKGGSSSLFEWLYAGLTGEHHFDGQGCATYVQNVSSPCWRGLVSPLYALPVDQQRRLLRASRSEPGTLRVAVQRDPFKRLVSLFRDKISCARWVGNADQDEERSWLVRRLRDQAGRPAVLDDAPNAGCMLVDEFAEVANGLRARLKSGALQRKDLDVHIRPQRFFFNLIEYDFVLDVRDLNDVRNLRPVLQRLPFRELDHVKSGPGRVHSTKKKSVEMTDRVEKLLRGFSSLSIVGKKKLPAN